MQSEKKTLSMAQRIVQFIRDCFRSNDHVDEVKNVPKNEIDSDETNNKVHCQSCNTNLPKQLIFNPMTDEEFEEAVRSYGKTHVSATTTAKPINKQSATRSTIEQSQNQIKQFLLRQKYVPDIFPETKFCKHTHQPTKQLP